MSMHNPSEDENFIEDSSDDASSVYSILQSMYADSNGGQESTMNPECWPPREDWPGATAFPSASPDGEVIAAFRYTSPVSKIVSTYAGEGRTPVEAAPKISLEALVHRLLQPGCATNESNFICAAIMLHADLSKHYSALKHYSKLNEGLRYCSNGSSHAWLYTPRRQSNRTTKSGNGCYEYVPEGLAMIFVYPDDSTTSRSANANTGVASSANCLRFGGRAVSLCDGNVLLQHGSNQHLGCVVQYTYPIGNDTHPYVFLYRELQIIYIFTLRIYI